MLSLGRGRGTDVWLQAWYESPAGRSFIAFGGWTTNQDGSWSYDEDVLEGVFYKPSPFEAAAEVCSIYLNPGGAADQEQKGVSFSLTPELKEWVEEYVVILTPHP